MYWACFDDVTGVRAVIYSPNDPAETSEQWTETYPFATEAEATESIERG